MELRVRDMSTKDGGMLPGKGSPDRKTPASIMVTPEDHVFLQGSGTRGSEVLATADRTKKKPLAADGQRSGHPGRDGRRSPGPEYRVELDMYLRKVRAELASVCRLWKIVPSQLTDSDAVERLASYSLMQIGLLKKLAEDAIGSSGSEGDGGSQRELSHPPDFGMVGVQRNTRESGRPLGQSDALLDLAKRHNFHINYAVVSAQDRKILRKFRRQFGQEPSVEFLSGLSAQDLLAHPGWGRTSVSWLKGFQRQLFDLMACFNEDQLHRVRSETPPLVSYRPAALDPEYIGWCLKYDFEHLLNGVTEEVRAVAVSRWSYRCKHQSLEEIGMSFGKTRERIRQLESGFNDMVALSMRIAPLVLRGNLEKYCQVDVAQLLPGLSSCFTRRRSFYEFIDLCTGMSGADGWVQNQWTDVVQLSYSDLENQFALKYEELDEPALTGVIGRIFGLSQVQSEQALRHFLETGRIRTDARGLYRPGIMRKNNAVAWVLLNFSRGLHWTRVYKGLREAGLLRSDHQEDRLDASFTENDKIFLIEQGTYCHKKYLNLSPEFEGAVIREVKEFLKRKDNNTANLQAVWVAVCRKMPVDYFKLRYVVSGPGVEAGLYFDGASRNDTVSLNPEAGRQTFRSSILDILESEGRAMTVEEISGRVGRSNAQLVGQQLKNLRSCGMVIKNARNQFALKSPVGRSEVHPS